MWHEYSSDNESYFVKDGEVTKLTLAEARRVRT